jgi:hypothetical protein
VSRPILQLVPSPTRTVLLTAAYHTGTYTDTISVDTRSHPRKFEVLSCNITQVEGEIQHFILVLLLLLSILERYCDLVMLKAEEEAASAEVREILGTHKPKHIGEGVTR